MFVLVINILMTCFMIYNCLKFDVGLPIYMTYKSQCEIVFNTFFVFFCISFVCVYVFKRKPTTTFILHLIF